MSTTTCKQKGVVILENLIAILIFSLGILGLAGLLVTSMKSTAHTRYRNEASLLANQIIGQMWLGDKSNEALKASFQSPSGTQYLVWKEKITGTAGTTNASDPGDSDDESSQDSQPALLPGSDLAPPTISIDDNNVVTVTIRWKAPGESATHSHVATARING